MNAFFVRCTNLEDALQVLNIKRAHVSRAIPKVKISCLLKPKKEKQKTPTYAFRLLVSPAVLSENDFERGLKYRSYDLVPLS